MDLTEALTFARQHDQGVLITLRAGGRPQSSNINYAVDAEGVIRISMTDGRAKAVNIRRDPRVSLHVSQPNFWAYVVLDCDAEVSPTAAHRDDATVQELIEVYRSIQGEHPDWDDYRRAMVDDHRLVLRLRPTYAYGMVG
jgi:PPOX class probable F420-dependent enzyme